MSRRRYPDEEKSRLLAEFQASGTTAAAFCREQGLCYQTFLNWRRSAPADDPAPERPEFIELDLSRPADAGSTPTMLVELELGGGIVLRVRRDPARWP